VPKLPIMPFYRDVVSISTAVVFNSLAILPLSSCNFFTILE
jgi:hypothetical protein